MNEKQIEAVAGSLAEPIVREVVNCVAERRYSDIPQYAQLGELSLSDLEELTEGFLELNEYTHIDAFDVPCNFKPRYEYHQLSCIAYNDGSGFHMDYDLTTNGDRNDLTLQMKFIFSPDGTVSAELLDIHVL